MKDSKIKNTVYTALFTATVAVLAQIAIPMPFGVPITLQTFATALSGYLLGPKYGVISIFLYIILGTVGVPVFSNFQGGLHFIVASPTGGFILGFIFISLFCGLSCLSRWKKRERLNSVLFGILGTILCHLCGSMQYASVTSIPFTTALITVSLPFILKDMIFTVLAYFLSVRLKKII